MIIELFLNKMLEAKYPALGTGTELPAGREHGDATEVHTCAFT
jgi:hypothetical protein